jgi:hypothetical protein
MVMVLLDTNSPDPVTPRTSQVPLTAGVEVIFCAVRLLMGQPRPQTRTCETLPRLQPPASGDVLA